jgi:hypothetical protein
VYDAVFTNVRAGPAITKGQACLYTTTPSVAEYLGFEVTVAALGDSILFCGIAHSDAPAETLFLCQTYGPATVVADGTIVVNRPCGVGGSTAGRIQEHNTAPTDIAGVLTQIGWSMENATVGNEFLMMIRGM